MDIEETEWEGVEWVNVAYGQSQAFVNRVTAALGSLKCTDCLFWLKNYYLLKD